MISSIDNPKHHDAGRSWLAAADRFRRGVVPAAAALLCAATLTLTLTAAPLASADTLAELSPTATTPPTLVTAARRGHKPARIDRSGRQRIGVASYYARRFAGRRMADGTRMRLDSDNAASRSLPLGTRAMVTNLSNGKTVMVTIRDRGPFSKGRIIDLSPHSAHSLGFIKAGLTQVAVVPVSLPPMASGEAAVVVASAGASAGVSAGASAGVSRAAVRSF